MSLEDSRHDVDWDVRGLGMLDAEPDHCDGETPESWSNAMDRRLIVAARGELDDVLGGGSDEWIVVEGADPSAGSREELLASGWVYVEELQ
jgi:hypothetical protein